MSGPGEAASREALLLSAVEGLGGRLFGRLVEATGSARALLAGPPEDLQRVEGVSAALARRIAEAPARHGEWADRELERAAGTGVRVLGYDEPDYPERLKHLPDPPPALWIRGDAGALSAGSLALVGSRRASPYGLEQAERFASSIAALGVVIVSGMARGIDTRAHEGALVAGGRTTAVLGSGLDVPYPPENRELADRIAASGVLATEHPLGTPPLPGHFPRRNRILAGLAWGVLVVEATARSGSLITADLAAELGREVFAIPGRIDSPTSKGTNDLLKDAAHLVTDVADLVRELPAFGSGPAEPVDLDEEEMRIVQAIGGSVCGFEEVARGSGLGASDAAALLTGLTLKGIVEEKPGNRFGLLVRL